VLVWTDFETTGLDPVEDEILEACVIVTEDFPSLKEIDRRHRVLNLTDHAVERMNDPKGDGWAKRAHSLSGLIPECMKSELTLAGLDKDVYGMLDGLRANKRNCMIAGSTVHFDRKFVDNQLPWWASVLNYRNFDVSVLSMACVALSIRLPCWGTRPEDKREKPHRATQDIEYSLTVAREYRDHVWMLQDAFRRVNAPSDMRQDAMDREDMQRFKDAADVPKP
jgi:oligoribonuclease